MKPKKPIKDVDEVDRQWAAQGAKVLARVAQGDCHLDDEGWWVETSTGDIIGIDPTTDRPILSDAEARQPTLADIKSTLANSLRQIWQDRETASVAYLRGKTTIDDPRLAEEQARIASAIVDAVVAIMQTKRT